MKQAEISPQAPDTAPLAYPPHAVLNTAQVADWLNAGSQLVWVIDPARRQAHVYRADGTESLVSDQESLDGAAVLPGFRCPLATIL